MASIDTYGPDLRPNLFEERLGAVAALMDVDPNNIRDDVVDCWQRFGCGPLEYFKNRMFELDDEQRLHVCKIARKAVEHHHAIALDLANNRIANPDERANRFCEDFAGAFAERELEHWALWLAHERSISTSDARSELAQAFKALRADPRTYCELRLFELPEDDQRAALSRALRGRRATLRGAKERADIVAQVANALDCNEDAARLAIEHAVATTGCLYNEFVRFKFNEIGGAHKQVFLNRQTKILRSMYDTDLETIALTQDKALADRIFDEYLHRPWCLSTRVDADEFERLFSKCARVFYKPCDGKHGTGIKSFSLEECSAQEVLDSVGALPEGVLEGAIVQHPVIAQLSPNAVGTLRIVTLSRIDHEDITVQLAYASLKMSGAASDVDNLKSGGFVAGIDVSTGSVCTQAVDDAGATFAAHPQTGATVQGTVIPFFAEACNMARSACGRLGLVGYLGWDIAITEDGPSFVEVNTDPGVGLCGLPYLSQKRGMREKMEGFMLEGELLEAYQRARQFETTLDDEAILSQIMFDEDVAKVALETGWSTRTALVELEAACTRLECSSKEYLAEKLFEVEGALQDERHREARIAHKKLRQAAKRLAAQHGISSGEARRALVGAQSKLGVDYAFYLRNDLYGKPREQQLKIIKRNEAHQLKRERQMRAEQATRDLAQRNAHVDFVAHELGLGTTDVARRMETTCKALGCSWREYFARGMYRMSFTERRELLCERDLDAARAVIADEPVELSDIGVNRVKQYRLFGSAIQRCWCRLSRTTREEFCALFKDCARLDYGQRSSEAGRGFDALDFDGHDASWAYNELIGAEADLVEQRADVHPDMHRLAEDAFPVYAIVVASLDGAHCIPLFATLRLSETPGYAGVAAPGEKVAPIDLAQGTLAGPALDSYGAEYVSNNAGIAFMGYALPDFDEAVALACDLSAEARFKGIFEWDLTPTPRGPEFISFTCHPRPYGKKSTLDQLFD